MRSALITGGTGGLGGAVTRSFLAAGWRCVVPYADERQAQALREATFGERRRRNDGASARRAPDEDASGESPAGTPGDLEQRLVLVSADLFDPDALAAVSATADEPAAPLEAAVNLVGGFDAPGRVHEAPVERFEAQLRVNLGSAYRVCAAALPGMVSRRRGAIVCVSSRAALRPFPGAAGYISAKAALLAFVDALDSEYRDEGIRVNAVIPSVIDTPANRASQPDADTTRWVKPSEIADVILFLCSSRASAVSGAHLPVYGRA